MFASVKARLPLIFAVVAVSSLVACSTPTSPTTQLQRADATASELTCKAWIVINGVPTCTEWEEG